MPTIDIINGIKIMLFSRDHLPPHLHAQFAEHKALIHLRTFEVIQGNMPNKMLKKVIEYAKENQEELIHVFYHLNPHLQ